MIEGANKIQKMKKFEIINCKKNISFYKDQMRKNKKNKNFYSDQIVFMQKKLDELKSNVDKNYCFEMLSELSEGSL